MPEEKKQGWVVRQFIITISLISQLSLWKAESWRQAREMLDMRLAVF